MLEKSIGLGNGTIGKWRYQSPSCDRLKLVADFLGTTLDYLVTGNNEHNSNSLPLDVKELIAYYNQMPQEERLKLLGRAEAIAEQYIDKSQKEIRLNDQTDDNEEIIINVAARGLGVTSVTTTKKAMEDLLALEPEDIDL